MTVNQGYRKIVMWSGITAILDTFWLYPYHLSSVIAWKLCGICSQMFFVKNTLMWEDNYSGDCSKGNVKSTWWANNLRIQCTGQNFFNPTGAPHIELHVHLFGCLPYLYSREQMSWSGRVIIDFIKMIYDKIRNWVLLWEHLSCCIFLSTLIGTTWPYLLHLQ